MTTAQRQFADLQRMLASVRPTIKVYEPTSRFRRLCYRMVIKKRGKFNKIMMFIIVLNIMVLSSEFQASPQWLSDLQGELQKDQEQI